MKITEEVVIRAIDELKERKFRVDYEDIKLGIEKEIWYRNHRIGHIPDLSDSDNKKLLDILTNSDKIGSYTETFYYIKG